MHFVPNYPIYSVLTLLSDLYPAEICALITLPEAEAATIIKSLVLENRGVSCEDAAKRVAEKLRDLLGIDEDESEADTHLLTQAEESIYLRICEGLPYSYEDNFMDAAERARLDERNEKRLIEVLREDDSA